jgi:hypothetical protein
MPFHHHRLLRFSPRMAVALLAAAAVLTGLVACDSAGTRADGSPSAAALHLTQADWQVQTDAGFTSPPLTLDGQILLDRWQPVTLPHAWNEDEAFKKDIKDLSTGIAWYRKTLDVRPTPGRRIFVELDSRVLGLCRVAYGAARLPTELAAGGWLPIDPAAV